MVDKKTKSDLWQDRVLKFLHNEGPCRLRAIGNQSEPRHLLHPNKTDERRILVSMKAIQAMLHDGLVERANELYRITETGTARRLRATAKGEIISGFQNQHYKTVQNTVAHDGSKQSVLCNLHESPLSRLRSRKMPDGNPWLDDAAFAAGEKLRSDFSRAQLMPNITSNWELATGISHRPTGAGGGVEMSDGAIDARQSFHRAMGYVGPELASLLTDVCCFLKGLEQVERERSWPRRSAKLLLKTGLDLLARYYGTVPGRHSDVPRNWTAN